MNCGLVTLYIDMVAACLKIRQLHGKSKNSEII